MHISVKGCAVMDKFFKWGLQAKTTAVLGGMISLLLLTSPAVSANAKNNTGGFIDLNVYPYLSDVSNDSTVTVNIGAKLANRFSYFSLTNFSNKEFENELSGFDNVYTEQNLRWQVTEQSPLDLTVQLNFRSGANNDRHRLGVRWRLNDTSALKSFFESINLQWSMNLHALQKDDVPADVWQMEHAFRMTFPYISDRLYLAGFVDHTFNEDLPNNIPNNPMVAEAQLGYRMVDNLYLISEYRVNQYRRSDVNNVALGFEYIVKW